MSTWSFALRLLKRDWRAGELRVLVAALVIAVASVTAVGFFTDRVQQAMLRQANELLAADLVIASSRPPADLWLNTARDHGLARTRTLSFPSVVWIGDNTQLVSIKAVERGYPLRGRLRVSTAAFGPETETAEIPSPGTVWLEPRLLPLLGAKPGDVLHVGSARLTITRVLTYEPDRGGNLFNLGPRVLMHWNDIPATGLVQAGSRVRYRLLLAGNAEALTRFRTGISPHLGSEGFIEDVREGRPELQAALDRAERFLGLATLIAVALAGVAVAVAGRRYASRHWDACAMLRCMGATQRWIAAAFLWQTLILGLLAGIAGCVLGYVAHAGIAYLLSDLLPAGLPEGLAAASVRPWAVGILTGLITLAGFALPPLLRLRTVPPARVLRRELGPLPPAAGAVYGAALVALAVLMLWQARDLKLAAYAAAGTAGTLMALSLAAYLLLRLVQPLRRMGMTWRLGIANLARRAQASSVQIVAFGLGITVILLLSLVRGDLLADWRRALSANTPNYFLINIQPGQLAPVARFFTDRRQPVPAWYPMVRGRLVAVNDRAITPRDFPEGRPRRLVEREFNLSWAAHPPADNRVVAGEWWSASAPPRDALSVEQGLAETLGLKVGDVLRFRIAGEDVEGRVANLRSLKWDTFRVNFFVLAAPGMLETYPATYITSLFLDEPDKPLLNALVRSFPNITALDVDAIIKKIREVMDKVTLAVEYVFLFSLLAGMAVLYAALQATHDERRVEGAILRALGASRRQLIVAWGVEFVALGLLAGLLAGLTASTVGYLLATRVFDFSYRVNPTLWLIGAAGGALGIGGAGLLGLRALWRQSPWSSLRQI